MTLSKRKKVMTLTGIIMLLAIVLLPLSGYIATGFANSTEAQIVRQNSTSDFWEKVRNTTQGYSAVSGQETNELIQGSGQNWRQLRNGPIATYGSLLLAGTLTVLVLFYLWRGQVKLTQARTGKTIERWTLSERRLHWLTAILFIILTITGLSLLYGRAVLIPLFGHQGFSSYATVAKLLHNFLGPVFMLALLVMIMKWLKHNFFSRVDWQWFKDFGGIVGDKHPSAEKMNGGEKVWFWSLVFIGLALSITGLVLDFTNFGQERELIQIAHLIHVSTALILIAFSFGHIYIGTIGTEGALEGMVTGQVDETWAKQHHDLWYAELQKSKTKNK